MELFKLFGTIAINAQDAINDLGRVTTAAQGAGREIGDGVDTGAVKAKTGVGGFISSGVEMFGKFGLAIQGASMVIGTISSAFAAPLEAFGKFEAKMKDVSTLIDTDGSGAIERYGDKLMALSIDAGKPLEDLSGGLYQAISAFGESAETMDMLGAAAKAATGGLASTKDAINLAGAVMKGYGEVNAVANQKALDLAQTAVKLGQTTFPERAARFYHEDHHKKLLHYFDAGTQKPPCVTSSRKSSR